MCTSYGTSTPRTIDLSIIFLVKDNRTIKDLVLELLWNIAKVTIYLYTSEIQIYKYVTKENVLWMLSKEFVIFLQCRWYLEYHITSNFFLSNKYQNKSAAIHDIDYVYPSEK